jgi:response regulator RpfG family c-di-GMP phosphodiesterase
MDSVYQLVRTWNPAIVEAEKPVPEAWAAGPPKEKLMKGYTNNVAPSHEYEEPKEALETARLEGLATLASGRTPDAINRTMVLAREALGMDVAFVSRFAEDRMEFRALEGDAESFGWQEGGGVPLEGTFCKRVVDGTLPNVVPDAGDDERVSSLEGTTEADIGSYVGLPLRFSDGRIYGTLCCLSHSPEPHLQQRDARFMEVLARLVADQIEREEMEAERRRLEVRATGVGALLAALVARDGYTADHSRAVVEHTVAVARQMGLSEGEVSEVEQVALLHDIGKIGVGDAILSKPGPLTDSEWGLMRMHPVIGEEIVASTKGLSHLAPAIRAEHERWDGKGYPDGLKGEEIPLASRIILVCDAFHAMTSDRPYRKGLEVDVALEALELNAGKQFCPHTVKAFVGMVEQNLA